MTMTATEQPVTDIDGPTIMFSLKIVNSYELYPTETTYVENHVAPAPPSEDSEDEFEGWVQEHIYNHTGVGHPDGDSFYDVTVTACSIESWIGREFEFGY